MALAVAFVLRLPLRLEIIVIIKHRVSVPISAAVTCLSVMAYDNHDLKAAGATAAAGAQSHCRCPKPELSMTVCSEPVSPDRSDPVG